MILITIVFMGFINQRSHHVWGHHLVGISLNIQVDLGDETAWTGKNYLEKNGAFNTWDY